MNSIPKEKLKQQRQLEADLQQFLKNKGTIQIVPSLLKKCIDKRAFNDHRYNLNNLIY